MRERETERPMCVEWDRNVYQKLKREVNGGWERHIERDKEAML